jgi:hypothetical protein
MRGEAEERSLDSTQEKVGRERRVSSCEQRLAHEQGDALLGEGGVPALRVAEKTRGRGNLPEQHPAQARQSVAKGHHGIETAAQDEELRSAKSQLEEFPTS